MKGTTESTAGENSRRGLFRRSRRTELVDTTEAAVATVDELARRMDELAVDGRSVADDPVRAEFDLQRAVIARANDIAAAATLGTTDTAPETHMPNPSNATNEQDDIEARLDAALQPISDATPAVAAPAQAAVLAPTSTPTPAAPTPIQATSTDAASRIGIDIDRVVRLIEEEASGVQHRIELELHAAQARAEEVLSHAETEAEKIREHGQNQARVLLGEVEEIISEAQQTGEQILLRANEEASTLRGEATNVITQAQTDARSIVETARREGEQVLAEQRRLATVRAQEAMREQDRLKDRIRRLEERRRQVLESLEPLISQLTQMMPTGVPVPRATPQNVVPLQQRQQPAAKG